MRNKKTIIFIIAVLFVLSAGIFYFFTANKSTKQNNDSFDNMQPSLSCAKEGESIGSCVGCVTKCCDGLRGMAHLKYESGCIKFPAPGSGATCSKCGNGICDKQNNEDECNCPEDCE